MSRLTKPLSFLIVFLLLFSSADFGAVVFAKEPIHAKVDSFKGTIGIKLAGSEREFVPFKGMVISPGDRKSTRLNSSH